MGIVRLQVEIDAEQMQELEDLMKLGDLRTKRDLLNNAFTLLKWAVKQKAQGNSVVSMNEEEGVYKELEMPFLERVMVNSRSKTPMERSRLRAGLPQRNKLIAT